jgi:hypothetical protein
MQGIDSSIFKPKGTDTEPAMLTLGENIVNAEASRIPGVQPMLDNLNNIGRKIQKQQGGPIPTYASIGGQVPMYSAEGDFVVDDSMLDAISQVESNNNPQALSGVGAGGQYQIMPATAQQPGYGTTPISLEDRFDPVKSRAFAKQYLQGIMRQHPEFSKEEVITAYHSGVGNVLKARSGQKNLGPEGQKYYGKVAEVMANAEPKVFDSTPMKSGFMSAQASTMSDREKKDAELLKGITQERDIDDRNVFTKMFSDAPNAEDPVLPMDDSESAQGIPPEPYQEGVGFGGLDKNIYSQFGPSGISPDSLSVESIVDNDPSGGELTSNIEAKKIAAQKITDQLNNEEDIDQTMMNNEELSQWKKDNPGKNIVEKFIDKGKKIGGPILDKSIEYFKNAFSSMFNGEELARMAMIYAGSRALGYNHGGSLNYSMKNYIKRVDANLAAAKKFSLTDKAREDYTEVSLKKYSKTGNRDDLIPKSKSVSVVSPAGSVYVKGIGVVPTFKMSDKSERLQIRGQYLLPDDPSIANRVEKIDSSVHGIAAIKKNFSDFIKSEMSVANSELGLGESTVNGVKKDNSFKVNDIELAQEAEAFYSNILKSNYLSLRDAAPYEAAVGRGIKQYIKALGYAKVNETRKPTSLKAYLNAQTFVPLSGVSVDMVSKTTPKEMLQITNKVVSQIPSKIRKSSPIYRLVFEAEWDMRIKAWQNLTGTQREEFNLQAAKRTKPASGTDVAVGWDGFTWWASKAKESEIKKILDDAGIPIPTVSG